MKGHWRFSLGFGVFGAVLTFLFQISRNTLGTTLIRSFYALLVFTLLMLAVGIALSVLLKPAAPPPLKLPAERSGSRIDLTTPNDGELEDLMKEQRQEGQDRKVNGFQPLNPQRLVSLDQPKAEEVAEAVRRMTEE